MLFQYTYVFTFQHDFAMKNLFKCGMYYMQNKHHVDITITLQCYIK